MEGFNIFKNVVVDNLLTEQFNFPNENFEFGIWKDDFSQLLNGTLNCHHHNYYEIAYLLEGSLDYYVNDKKVSLKSGETIFLNNDTLHMAVDNCRSAKIIVIVFSKDLVTGKNEYLQKKYIENIFKNNLAGFKIENSSVNGLEINKIVKLISELDIQEPMFELRAISLVTDIWLKLINYYHVFEDNAIFLSKEKIIRKEQTTKKLLFYIANNYQEKLSVDDLCKSVNISRSECFRSFKLFTKKKPLEFINEKRLLNSVNLLLETDLTVNEISKACGFSSNSYFTKQFKEEFGCAPLKFRLEERR